MKKVVTFICNDILKKLGSRFANVVKVDKYK